MSPGPLVSLIWLLVNYIFWAYFRHTMSELNPLISLTTSFVPIEIEVAAGEYFVFDFVDNILFEWVLLYD